MTQELPSKIHMDHPNMIQMHLNIVGTYMGRDSPTVRARPRGAKPDSHKAAETMASRASPRSRNLQLKPGAQPVTATQKPTGPAPQK